MSKRLLTMLVMFAVGLSAFAYSFSGKTYKGTFENGATMTISFTSPSRGSCVFKGDGKPEKLSFSYEVSGDIINAYMRKGIDYFYIDSRHQYGADCIYILDPYGNVFVVLHRTETPAAPSSSKKKSKTRR